MDRDYRGLSLRRKSIGNQLKKALHKVLTEGGNIKYLDSCAQEIEQGKFTPIEIFNAVRDPLNLNNCHHMVTIWKGIINFNPKYKDLLSGYVNEINQSYQDNVHGKKRSVYISKVKIPTGWTEIYKDIENLCNPDLLKSVTVNIKSLIDQHEQAINRSENVRVVNTTPKLGVKKHLISQKQTVMQEECNNNAGNQEGSMDSFSTRQIVEREEYSNNNFKQSLSRILKKEQTIKGFTKSKQYSYDDEISNGGSKEDLAKIMERGQTQNGYYSSSDEDQYSGRVVKKKESHKLIQESVEHAYEESKSVKNILSPSQVLQKNGNDSEIEEQNLSTQIIQRRQGTLHSSDESPCISDSEWEDEQPSTYITRSYTAEQGFEQRSC